MIAAEVQLTYRTRVPAKDRPKIGASNDAYQVLRNHWDHDTMEHRESSKVLFLNQANKVLGIMDLSEGGITATVIDLRVVFQGALKANACNIILAHNHPSGNLKPSEQDIRITRDIKKAGEILQISLVDHIIISTDGYMSMADEGHIYN